MARSQPWSRDARRHGAFSLVEMVLVVVIIGIITAIAVPRVGSAVTHATAGSLEATLANARKAVDMYYAEHGSYPGYDPSNGTPNGTWFVKQLVEYSNARGQTNPTRSGAFLYGPYLRRPFPKNPFNGLDTVFVKAAPGSPDPADGSVGWVAVLSLGYFGVSATDGQFGDIGIDILDPLEQQTYRGLSAF